MPAIPLSPLADGTELKDQGIQVRIARSAKSAFLLLQDMQDLRIVKVKLSFANCGNGGQRGCATEKSMCAGIFELVTAVAFPSLLRGGAGVGSVILTS